MTLVVAIIALLVGALVQKPATVTAVRPTASVRTALLHTFVLYKLHNHQAEVSDRVSYANSDPAVPGGLLVADDPKHTVRWALASFQLAIPASYAAEVSFQDGGSYGIFQQRPGKPWVLSRLGTIPLCPSVVPKAVAHAWHLPTYPREVCPAG